MKKKKGNKYLMAIDLEQEEKQNIVVPFKPKLITGGKGPPGHNWLSDLNEGCVFLCKAAQSGGFALGQFHLMHKLDNAVHLMDNLQGETHIWVDPQSFSSQFKLVTILFDPKEEE